MVSEFNSAKVKKCRLERKMGPRGEFGFYHKGKCYWVYNSYYSYNLEKNLLAEIHAAIADGSIDSWIDMLDP